MSLAFYAATYNNQTFECLEVPIGTGPATYTTPAGLLLPGHDGVYVSIGAGEAPWHGARWDGGVPYADNGAGALLDPLPSLYAAPALTNDFEHSNDLTQEDPPTYPWQIANGTLVRTFDQVGLTGAPNTATLVNDTDGLQAPRTYQDQVIPSDNNPHTIKVMVGKDSDESRFPNFEMTTLGGGPSQDIRVQMNTATGASAVVSSTGTVDHEVRDAGLWWELLLQVANNSTSTSMRLSIYPAYAPSLAGGVLASLTGSIVVGNAEIHLNKTIAEVRGSAPIITAGSAGSTVAVGGNYPLANHDNTQGAWYAEALLERVATNQGIITDDTANDLMFTAASERIRSYDGTTNVQSASSAYAASTAFKAGMAYGGSNRNVNVDGSWSTEGAYDGDFGTAGALAVGRNRTGILLVRNIRRYDDAYDDAKAQIDELMAGTDGGFPLPSGNRPDSKNTAIGGPGNTDDLEQAWLKANS